MMPAARRATSAGPGDDVASGGSAPGAPGRTYLDLAGRLARAADLFGATIGGVFLLAWWSGAVARWSAAGALTMKTNMALALLLAGLALVLIDPPEPSSARRAVGAAFGAVVLLIGVATLGEHLFGWDLGIDQLLASEPAGAVGTASPNRIGLPGSTSLALLGAGLVLSSRRRPLAVYLGLATCVVVVVPAIGFLYGVSPFYATRSAGIAWPTVVALLALGLGLVLSRRESSPFGILWRDDPGGELVRRLLVPSVLILLVLGWARLEGERRGLYDGLIGSGLYTVVVVLVLSALLLLTARQLSAYATLRQRTLDQLAAEKERLGVTVRSIGDAVIATDGSGRVTLVNRVAEVLTGWRAEEAVGRPLSEVFRIVNEQTRQPVESPVERVLREGAVVALANHTALVARDGTERPIADSGAPIRDAEGRLAGVVLVFRDQTEERRAGAALRESEQRLRALADSMPQLAWTARPDGYITWYNRRWYEYTGKTPEQLEGWGWQAVHDPATLPDVMRRWTASIASGAAFEMEFPLRGADGTFRRFLTRVFPLKDRDGSVLQWFGTNTDVTELLQAQDALREAARRKDEFLGMLSHELRNPLAPIRNAVYVLEHAEATSERAVRARAAIKRQAEHLTRIVDDLLDVTRIARGKIELHRARVELGALASHAADDFRQLMGERNVAFRTALPEAEVWVDADATRLTQVLGNLLHNAAKFTRSGDEVVLALHVVGEEAELSVSDTGAGVEPTLLEHLFDPFVQGERTLARTEGGLGLGLAVVKAVAELHGGSARAESAGAGRGATFRVRIPLAASGGAPA